MCLGGDWEVQAWYMRGTCVVQVTPGPGKAFPRRRSQGRDGTRRYQRRSRTGAAKFKRYSGATELGSCIKSTGLALFQTESHFRRAEGRLHPFGLAGGGCMWQLVDMRKGGFSSGGRTGNAKSQPS